MPQVKGPVIKDRAARLRAAGDAALAAHLAAQVGVTHRVLMEGPRMGRTEQFTEVDFGDGSAGRADRDGADHRRGTAGGRACRCCGMFYAASLCAGHAGVVVHSTRVHGLVAHRKAHHNHLSAMISRIVSPGCRVGKSSITSPPIMPSGCLPAMISAARRPISSGRHPSWQACGADRPAVRRR
jgi:hypothetical protein